KFELPKKLPSRVDEDINWSVVIVDATETPIERPKKTRETTIVARRNNIP
ncbi:IS5/IS1182 family transposase, partial [Psychrobacter sp. Choline-3u-12]